MLTEIPSEEYHAVLDRCVEDVLWEANLDRPPVDAFVLAARLGVVVATDAVLPGRARFARLAAGAERLSLDTIVIAAEERPERRHFAVAHEVGEAHAYRVYESLGVDPCETAGAVREGVANALAGRLLAPRRWLTGLWRDLEGDLFELKTHFATASHELIARRVLECVRTPLVITVTDNGRPLWRRWNRSGPAPPRLRLELDCQRDAHASGRVVGGLGCDEPQSAAGTPIDRVRCWPVHEPGWRREITVTELVDSDSEWL
ncbi:hypothetical protein Pla108_28960 [Botrimarina colliarenosi]|uniref:IrrE N-terminal-like domain-containing protein n=1 Tax=Botrimarina colliarenosi TaxID=2528001 RepID=A0A5C6A8E3_9BACT|nr:ImmA/IrrE family metallo-endopeptidase [Botrimarina colliarenosi]TWT95819.1 hypothetical protein Pla108_28960 [Botrimarina colliarenosi]